MLDLKKELPRITKRQLLIVDFWQVRGYSELNHVLGHSIHLNRKPEHQMLGLDLQYLEQFYELAQDEICESIKKRIDVLKRVKKRQTKDIKERIEELKLLKKFIEEKNA